jgi:hypothetical protein
MSLSGRVLAWHVQGPEFNKQQLKRLKIQLELFKFYLSQISVI